MFEKEAEEYAIENYETCLYDDLPYANDSRAREQSFKDGAEFGYNKAKQDADKMKSQFLELCNLKDMRIEELEKASEWHYVKDGDLPKDEKDMLMSDQLILLAKMKGTNNLSISIGQYNFSTQEFSYPHFVGLTEIYAWKVVMVTPKSNYNEYIIEKEIKDKEIEK